MFRIFAVAFVLLASAAAQPGSAGDSVAKAFAAKLNEGKPQEAEDLARQLLADEEAAHRDESLDRQRGFDLLLEIFAYRAVRSTPEIDLVGRQAVALREKLQGPDSLATAQTLRLWAVAQIGLGNYSSARSIVERSVRIFENAEKAGYPFTRGDIAQYSRALSNMAGITTFMMDFHTAKRLLLKSVALKTRLASKSPGMGDAYMNLGRLEHYLGNHAEALAQYEKARRSLEAQVKPDDPLLVELAASEANCEYENGNKAQGLAKLEGALRQMEATYGDDHVSISSTIDKLVELYRLEGRFAEASKLGERSVAIDRKAFGPLHPDVAESEAHLSQVLGEAGDGKGSLRHALEAERVGREHLTISIPTLPEREATLFALKRVSAMKMAVSGAVDMKGEAVEPVYDALVRSRALVFDELASRQRVRGSAQEDAGLIAKLNDELRLARERLARAALASGGPSSDGLQQALEERDAADRKLAAASVQYRRRIVGRAAGLKEVAAVLPEGMTLVSFVQFEHVLKGTPTERDEYAVFVMSRGISNIVWLGTAAEINGAVDEVRARLASEAAAPGVAMKRNEAGYRTAADKLRKLVWDPIDRYIAGSKAVFIVPDGTLHMVNFAALPEAGAEGRYLIERGMVFHYLSAERDLLMEASPDAPGVGLLAVGNPSFNRPELARGKVPGRAGDVLAVNVEPVFRGTRSTCSAMQAMRFADLPSSAREVENISRLWKRGAGGEVVELTGEMAGPERFKAMAPGKRTIHLAVHGFVAATDCTDPIRNENPLLLTGLALAGANRREAGEDGILTAEEIASLDLRGVEWAVLSACDTGLGKATQSEGVFGLRRAFQIAGAHTVIMSLWPVEDRVTTEWMQTLYEQRLNKQKDTASAVRWASLETLRKRRAAGMGTHPFYWAPFVAVGDWR